MYNVISVDFRTWKCWFPYLSPQPLILASCFNFCHKTSFFRLCKRIIG